MNDTRSDSAAEVSAPAPEAAAEDEPLRLVDRGPEAPVEAHLARSGLGDTSLVRQALADGQSVRLAARGGRGRARAHLARRGVRQCVRCDPQVVRMSQTIR